VINQINEHISQINTKHRVDKHGEVFTNHREVNAMLDLVKQEAENIDSRFLEPACGTGNFLIEILRRKLMVVAKRYGKNQIEYERYSVAALCSIYGVELLEDNAQICRERVFGVFSLHYAKLFKKGKTDLLKAASYIINKNIICGNALTLKYKDDKPIIFSEWSFVKGSFVKRREFYFQEMLKKDSYEIFQDHIISDEGKPAFVSNPTKEYPLIHFLKLGDGT
jgi:hypothetical protein